MIQSNVIVAKNATNKKYQLFTGIVDERQSFYINAKYASFIEVTVFVQEVTEPNTFVQISRQGAFYGDANNPEVMDSDGKLLPNNIFTCRTSGQFTIFVDTKSYDRIAFAIFKNGESVGADITISYTMYSEKFTALDYIKNKSAFDTPANQTRRIDGTNSIGSIVYPVRPKKRYMLLAFNLFTGGSASSHYFVRVADSQGQVVYPASYDVSTGKQVSYGNGQVYLSANRDTYIDLYQCDAQSVSIGAGLNDPELQGIIYTQGFVDEIPKRDIVEKDEDILLEGENFKFVKKGTFMDAWNGLTVDRFNTGIYLSDLNNPRQLISAQSAVDAEGAGVAIARLIPYDVNKRNTTVSTRVNIVLGNGAVYHNYANGGGISDWAKSKFWEMRNTKRKIPVKTLEEVSPLHRFDPTLSDERYDRNATITESGHTFIEYQEKPNFTYLGPLCRTKKMVLWGSYLTTGERIGVWMSTDGGANWVLFYDFIDRLALLPNPVNTNLFAEYTGGLSLKKVNMIYPSESDKEPAEPFTYADLTLTTITKGTETIVTAPAHGLQNGDIILFTGTAQDANWQALTCDEFTAQGFKQNVYSVTKLSDDTFQLKIYIGSYDTPLSCRHVHSINESIGGCIVSTGEEHPNGWFLYISQKFKDGSTVVDAFNFPKSMVYRLNSSAEGIQRACGLLMDNAPDPNIIFNCDTSNKNLGVYSVDGRTTGLPLRSSNGIWRGKLSDIDDWTKFECVADIPEPAIWMYEWNGVILGYYQLGGMAISLDGGATWQYFSKGSSNFSGVFDDRIAIGGGYLFEWKNK